jgi:hypothetical protein
MQTLQTRNPAHAALLIGALVGFVVQPAAAQSVHRTKVQIVAGTTVQVSKAFPSLTHGENLAAGDLEHMGRLITCSMVFPDDGYRAFVIYQNCYASFDSGKTWEAVLKLTEGWGDQDPVATYGRGDDVYVVTLVSREPDKPKDPDPDAPRAHDDDTVVYKSTDGGHTWREASRLDPIDREFINVDTTNGKYTGRIYVVGQGSVKDIAHGEARHSLQMWRSLDNGRTFLGPVHAAYPQGSILFGVGTGAVLSDGTLVALFGITKSGRDQNLEQEPTVGPNAELHVITSRDGGETFSPSHKIADVKLDRQRSEGGILNQLTADPGSKAFKDRLYVVYPEIVSDRIQIRFSYSSDKGKTWSRPVTVNDDRSPEKGAKGPDHLLPSVGVNKDGVVLVTWYDRREAKDNLGWRMRAAASLDGGETFSASVPITDFANAYTATTRWHVSVGANSDDKTSLVSVFAGLDPFFVSGGHTTGLAVDADGTFHPTWIDNHTGVAQLWSVSLKVDGTVVKHGAVDLADLKDISKSVTLELSKPDFDRVKGTLSVSARLKNISKDTVEEPVKVRVLTLESDLGVPEITNADNGQDGTGGVWDFTPQLSGAPLATMKLSAPRTLTFRVSDLRPLAPGKDFKRGVLNLETRVFGKLHKEKSDKDKDKDKESEEEKNDK